jgi:RNA polymerase sigma-70 factor (ECF subfamily)
MDRDAERELIAQCRRGEANAWDELFDAHYEITARFIYQLAPDFTREDVEEICQETFLAVVRSLSGFNGASRLQTWILRVATNKSHDHRERQQAAKRGGGLAIQSLQAQDPETGLSLDPPGTLPSPDTALIREENAALLHRALDELGNPCREIIELRYFGDLSYDEIANLLALNVKTVSSRLSKCLDRLESIAHNVFNRDPREKSRPFPV